VYECLRTVKKQAKTRDRPPAPLYEEYPITVCGKIVILTNGELAAIENGHIDRDTEDSIKSRLVAALFKFRFDEQKV